MKITKSQLKRIIKEELQNVLKESSVARRTERPLQPGHVDSADKYRGYDLARSTPGAQSSADYDRKLGSDIYPEDEEYWSMMEPGSPYYEEDIEDELRQQAEKLGIDPEVYMANYRASQEKT